VRREAADTPDGDTINNRDWYFYGFDAGDRTRDFWSLADRKWKQMPFHHPEAVGVAYRKAYFGEGAERLVAKFREVNKDGRFVGPALVAKETRFESDTPSGDGFRAFHKVFAQTQGRAKELAEKFNERLSLIPGVCASTPRVDILDCSIYEFYDCKLGLTSVLVEKQLDVQRYDKWNDNNGGVDGKKAEVDFRLSGPGKARTGQGAHPDAPGSAGQGGAYFLPHPTLAQVPGYRKKAAPGPGPGSGLFLGTIEEYNEEDETSDEGSPMSPPPRALPEPIIIKDFDIPQAFSHFTYRYTKRKELVCDLQGVFTSSADKSNFEFTDPVIHHHSATGRKNVYGRTDRGKDGIESFFKTHKCSGLCEMLNRNWVKRSAVWSGERS